MNFDMKSALTRQETLQRLCEHWNSKRDCVLMPMEKSLGCVTAKDVYAANTLPVYRVSSFDGYAVRSSDFEHGLPDTSAWSEGNEYVRADTGDDFPDEYDTIVAVEDVTIDEKGGFHFNSDFSFVKGDAVRAPGTMVRCGELIAPANTKITPELMASLAVGGVRLVPVIRPLKVAYIPTGSELIPTGARPNRGENVEANGIMLSSFLAEWGAETLRFPIIRDNKLQLEEALEQALSCSDLVIINGGSSRGGEDLNSYLLQQKGEYFSHGVRAVPGRPVGTAMIYGKPVVNVPGPVLAAWLASGWLLCGLVHHYYGLPVPQRQKVKAVLTSDIKKGDFFRDALRVHLDRTQDGFSATPIARSSSMPFSMREANGLLILPIGCRRAAAGDIVEVELLKGAELI